jgi:ElaB/YqjD/DUF883 family membrane-anchored ribosome-binding protein
MSATGSTERLVDDLQVVIEDAEALLQATAAQTGEKIEGARTRAAESLKKARHRLAGIEHDAMREVREAARATDDYVHQKPWAAVGIAVGVGLVFGLLIGRR